MNKLVLRQFIFVHELHQLISVWLFAGDGKRNSVCVCKHHRRADPHADGAGAAARIPRHAQLHRRAARDGGRERETGESNFGSNRSAF